MRDLLSSRWTLALKVVFPAIWLLGFGGVSLMISIERGDVGLGLLFAVVAAVGLAVCARTLLPLKRVVAESDGLRVSNFVRETRIAYGDIASVREWFWYPRTIEIRLFRASVFGDRILFVPFAPFVPRSSNDHTATKFLKKQAGLGERGPSSPPKQAPRT